MLVDIGSVCMCIDETIQSQLQIPVIEKRKGQLANGSIVEYDIVGPIVVIFPGKVGYFNFIRTK